MDWQQSHQSHVSARYVRHVNRLSYGCNSSSRESENFVASDQFADIRQNSQHDLDLECGISAVSVVLQLHHFTTTMMAYRGRTTLCKSATSVSPTQGCRDGSPQRDEYQNSRFRSRSFSPSCSPDSRRQRNALLNTVSAASPPHRSSSVAAVAHESYF